jgi:MFS family permease
MITFIGLSFGSTFWGIASDIIGRRPAFNATLLICGLFGAVVAAGPSWIITSILFGCMGLGVGGNLPVDGALFLEFLPFASNKLLTLLSVWWPVGQLVASMSTYRFVSSSISMLIVSSRLGPNSSLLLRDSTKTMLPDGRYETLLCSTK